MTKTLAKTLLVLSCFTLPAFGQVQAIWNGPPPSLNCAGPGIGIDITTPNLYICGRNAQGVFEWIVAAGLPIASAAGQIPVSIGVGANYTNTTSVTINVAFGQVTANEFITPGPPGFQSLNPNGGYSFNLGNGSALACTPSNSCAYGDSLYNGIHNINAQVDQGIFVAGGPGTPARDLSVALNTSAMAAQSTATLTPITGMSWNIAPSKNYVGWCEVPVTFAASATIAFGLIGPGTPTSYNLDAYGTIGAAAAFQDLSLQSQTTWATTKTGASGAPGAAEIIHVNFQIQNGTSAGAVSLNTSANGTNTITIGANAACHVMQIN